MISSRPICICGPLCGLVGRMSILSQLCLSPWESLMVLTDKQMVWAFAA